MSWRPEPSPWERDRRERLAEEGLDHLDRFRSVVATKSEASDAADALIAACGGLPPDVVESTPEADSGRRKRRELAGLILDRERELRAELEAERDGLTFSERTSVPAERLPDNFARAFTPLLALERMIDEARWIASLVRAAG